MALLWLAVKVNRGPRYRWDYHFTRYPLADHFALQLGKGIRAPKAK